MRLEYSILWFEDRKEYVDAYKNRIADYLEELGGFVLDLKDERTGSNLDKLLEEHDFDLILVDLNLNPDKMGNTAGSSLVDRIRRHEIYTEIIFYGVTRSAAMKSLKAQVDGVYFTDRENFFEKIRGVILLTLKKNLHVANTRGLFIAETIDLIEQVEEIISRILKLKNEELMFFQECIIQVEFFNDDAKYTIIKDFLNGKIELLEKKKETAKTGEKAALEMPLEELEQIKKVFNRFKQDVIEIRNQLAHAKIVSAEKNTIKVRNKSKRCYENIKFDMEKCKEMRKNLMVQAENLRIIASLVASD